MANGTFLKTLYLHMPGALSTRVGGETLVVCGTARGMTSATAYALHECGYFLGNHLGEKNYEDIEWLELFQAKHTAKQQGVKDLIAARNADHDRWGFKLPMASEFVEELLPMIRKPVFLFCVRNPLASCSSVAKRETQKIDPLNTLHKSRILMDAMLFLRDRNQPFIAADMDMVRRQPLKFVRELQQALMLEGDTEGIAKALASPGYKPANPQPGITYKPQ